MTLAGECDVANVRLARMLTTEGPSARHGGARIILSTFKRKLVKIQGVLEAEKEDQLADFNAEDFKRLEKEDERHRECKQKEKQLCREPRE